VNNRRVITKLIAFIIIYLAILGALQIAPIRSLYVSAYSEIQQAIFNSLHPSVHTDFATYIGTEKEFDYTITITESDQPQAPIAKINQGAGKTAIVPFVLLIALLIVGPGNIKRKLLCGLIISLLLFVIIAMKYTLLIHQNAPQLSPDSSIWISLSSALQGIYRTHESLYIIILAAWLLLTWTTDDVKKLV